MPCSQFTEPSLMSSESITNPSGVHRFWPKLLRTPTTRAAQVRVNSEPAVLHLDSQPRSFRRIPHQPRDPAFALATHAQIQDRTDPLLHFRTLKGIVIVQRNRPHRQRRARQVVDFGSNNVVDAQTAKAGAQKTVFLLHQPPGAGEVADILHLDSQQQLKEQPNAIFGVSQPLHAGQQQRQVVPRFGRPVLWIQTEQRNPAGAGIQVVGLQIEQPRAFANPVGRLLQGIVQNLKDFLRAHFRFPALVPHPNRQGVEVAQAGHRQLDRNTGAQITSGRRILGDNPARGITQASHAQRDARGRNSQLGQHLQRRVHGVMEPGKARFQVRHFGSRRRHDAIKSTASSVPRGKRPARYLSSPSWSRGNSTWGSTKTFLSRWTLMCSTRFNPCLLRRTEGSTSIPEILLSNDRATLIRSVRVTIRSRASSASEKRSLARAKSSPLVPPAADTGFAIRSPATWVFFRNPVICPGPTSFPAALFVIHKRTLA